MEKSCRKCALKASPIPLVDFSAQNSHCMQAILLKVGYFKIGLSESLKKVLLLNPVPFKVNRSVYIASRTYRFC